MSTIADRAPGTHARPTPPRQEGRSTRTGLATASLLALALVGAVALPSHAASSSSAKTLQLAAVTIQATTLDLGAAGPSQGDESILTRQLFLDGNKVGTAHLASIFHECRPRGRWPGLIRGDGVHPLGGVRGSRDAWSCRASASPRGH